MAQKATERGVAAWLRRTRESRLGTVIVLVATALVVSFAAYSVKGSPDSTGSGVTAVTLTAASTGASPEVGKMAPDFTATTTDGKTVPLSSLRGHPVWLTFGASWCSACRAEAADIEAAYQKAKPGGAVVLEVFISEDAPTVKAYSDRVGLTYLKMADPGTEIASAYRVLGIPAHFFIDGQGVIRSVKAGSLTPERMDAALAEVGP
jgi:peroxiredoxin